MVDTEAGHAPSRFYMDADGILHLNGSTFATDESGNVLSEGELELLDGLNTSGKIVQSTATLTLGEADVLDGVTAGTVTASKALVVNSSKELDVMMVTSETVTPAADSGAGSLISAGVTSVTVAAVTNDADDWIVLPAVAGVPIGHQIVVACNAGGGFEIRTPASSNTKINTVDSDGPVEYLATDTEVITFTLVSAADGWVATALSAAGAVVTAVVPD